ncbi:MAG: hypothetical protein N3A72_02740 [bacterium]|nr:hypothetical protein [bacterium]
MTEYSASKRIGELLIEQKLITPAILEQALSQQRQELVPLGKIFIQLGCVSEDQLNSVLASQFGLVYLNPRSFVLQDTSLLNFIPESLARRFVCFPLEKKHGTLLVVMADPWNTDAINELTKVTQLTIQPKFSRHEWIEQIIDKYYNSQWQKNN